MIVIIKKRVFQPNCRFPHKNTQYRDVLDEWEHSAHLVEVCPKVRRITGFFLQLTSPQLFQSAHTKHLARLLFCSETPQSDYAAIVLIIKKHTLHQILHCFYVSYAYPKKSCFYVVCKKTCCQNTNVLNNCMVCSPQIHLLDP